jgi:hypothetical protein
MKSARDRLSVRFQKLIAHFQLRSFRLGGRYFGDDSPHRFDHAAIAALMRDAH